MDGYCLKIEGCMGNGNNVCIHTHIYILYIKRHVLIHPYSIALYALSGESHDLFRRARGYTPPEFFFWKMVQFSAF